MVNSLSGRIAVPALLLAALNWIGEARAAEAVGAAPPPATAAATPSGAQGLVLRGARPVALSVLAASRGGTQVFNEMNLNGVVADNQAINLTTGGNTIAEGAFANASGLPMVVQNSGNNVLIQNATIVNVQVK